MIAMDQNQMISTAMQNELARCDREIAEITARADRETLPAWLVTLGYEDWQMEKRLIVVQQSNSSQNHSFFALKQGVSLSPQHLFKSTNYPESDENKGENSRARADSNCRPLAPEARGVFSSLTDNSISNHTLTQVTSKPQQPHSSQNQQEKANS